MVTLLVHPTMERMNPRKHSVFAQACKPRKHSELTNNYNELLYQMLASLTVHKHLSDNNYDNLLWFSRTLE